jgi:hypothetical protein
MSPAARRRARIRTQLADAAAGRNGARDAPAYRATKIATATSPSPLHRVRRASVVGAPQPSASDVADVTAAVADMTAAMAAGATAAFATGDGDADAATELRIAKLEGAAEAARAELAMVRAELARAELATGAEREADAARIEQLELELKVMSVDVHYITCHVM